MTEDESGPIMLGAKAAWKLKFWPSVTCNGKGGRPLRIKFGLPERAAAVTVRAMFAWH
jgi:hypothetical protein